VFPEKIPVHYWTEGIGNSEVVRGWQLDPENSRGEEVWTVDSPSIGILPTHNVIISQLA